MEKTRWDLLGMGDKAKLMRIYIRNGIRDLGAMKAHYNGIGTTYAEGGHLYALGGSPDWDPNNPYHYHNEKGKKVVIEPEVWEANVGQPYFKNIEDAVNAERAAHPGPEYEVDTEWLKQLEDVHRAAARDYAGFQNYRNYPQGLPEGWRFTEDGMIIDNNGNYYVQRGLKLGDNYNVDYSKPYKHTINVGKPIESSRFYYPIEMKMIEKKPLKVDKVMNVDEEREKAIKEYNLQNSYRFNVYNLISGSHSGLWIDPEIFGEHIEIPYNYSEQYLNNLMSKRLSKLLNRNVEVDKKGNFNVSNDEYKILRDRYYNIAKRRVEDYIKTDLELYEDELKWEKENPGNLGNSKDILKRIQGWKKDLIKTKNNPWLYEQGPRKINEGKQRAIIRVGPLESKVLNYSQGGHLYALGGNPDWDPNNPYHYHNEKGEKVVVTPEDWEKFKDDPAFAEYRKAIEAEQAAHPGPEYEVDKNFVADLRDAVNTARRNWTGKGFLNWRNYGSALPEGYTIDDAGIVYDANGNAYVQPQFDYAHWRNSDFTRKTEEPVNMVFNQGKPVEQSVSFYPIDMKMVEKQPLPVKKTVDIGEAMKENAYTPTYYRLPVGDGVGWMLDPYIDFTDNNGHFEKVGDFYMGRWYTKRPEDFYRYWNKNDECYGEDYRKDFYKYMMSHPKKGKTVQNVIPLYANGGHLYGKGGNKTYTMPTPDWYKDLVNTYGDEYRNWKKSNPNGSVMDFARSKGYKSKKELQWEWERGRTREQREYRNNQMAKLAQQEREINTNPLLLSNFGEKQINPSDAVKVWENVNGKKVEIPTEQEQKAHTGEIRDWYVYNPYNTAVRQNYLSSRGIPDAHTMSPEMTYNTVPIVAQFDQSAAATLAGAGLLKMFPTAVAAIENVADKTSKAVMPYITPKTVGTFGASMMGGAAVDYEAQRRGYEGWGDAAARWYNRNFQNYNGEPTETEKELFSFTNPGYGITGIAEGTYRLGAEAVARENLYRRLHAFNSIAPMGYGNNSMRVKEYVKDLIKHKPVDLEMPKWYRELIEKSTGMSYDELLKSGSIDKLRPSTGYTGTGQYIFKGVTPTNTGGAKIADEARVDAWALHNKFPQVYGTYKQIGPRTYTYDMSRIMKLTNGEWRPWITPKKVDVESLLGPGHKGLDFVTGAGGYLTGFYDVAKDEIGNGIMRLEDTWDVHPLRRKGQQLQERLTEKTKYKEDKRRDIVQKFRKWMYDKGYWGNGKYTKLDSYLNRYRTGDFNSLLYNLENKLVNSKAVEKLSNKMTDVEIGRVTGGKPFKMVTDIKYHIPTIHDIMEELYLQNIKITPENISFYRTPRYGFNPNYFSNVKPVINNDYETYIKSIFPIKNKIIKIRKTF